MPDDLRALLDDYQDALAYTDRLWGDLSNHDITWRPNEHSSAIGWHLGHQAAVAHFMIRNLTAAEPSPDAELEGIMDSATDATTEAICPTSGDLPATEPWYASGSSPCRRHRATGRRRSADLHFIAINLLVALINHEYQHDKWIGEVRTHLGTPCRPRRLVSAHDR